MKKTYPDICLERAEKATEGPWRYNGSQVVMTTMLNDKRTHGYGCDNDFVADLNDNEYHNYSNRNEQDAVGAFIAHARTDVPELCRRLKKACEYLRGHLDLISPGDGQRLADELEAPSEETK